MRFRNLFLLLCLLTTPLLKASSDPSGSSDNESYSCDIPEPDGFKVMSRGLTWAHLVWKPTNPNYQHRINIYRCLDSAFVKSVIVTAGVTDTTITFSESGVCYFEIKAICFSGDSPHSAWATAWPPTGYILELVAQGFTQSGNMANCTLSEIQGGERCYFPDNVISTFRVRQVGSNIYKAFGVERVSSYNGYRLKVPTQNNELEPNYYNFYVDLKSPPAFGEQYQIKYSNQIIARFFAGKDPGSQDSYLESVFIMPGYEIVRTSPEGEYRPSDPPGDRNENASISAQPATAAPNPFIDRLDVFLPPTAETVQLQLFNLSGQKVLDQQFAGGQEQYSLPTANLATGFYLLRIDADGEVQTLKVIKSE